MVDMKQITTTLVVMILPLMPYGFTTTSKTLLHLKNQQMYNKMIEQFPNLQTPLNALHDWARVPGPLSMAKDVASQSLMETLPSQVKSISYRDLIESNRVELEKLAMEFPQVKDHLMRMRGIWEDEHKKVEDLDSLLPQSFGIMDSNLPHAVRNAFVLETALQSTREMSTKAHLSKKKAARTEPPIEYDPISESEVEELAAMVQEQLLANEKQFL